MDVGWGGYYYRKTPTARPTWKSSLALTMSARHTPIHSGPLLSRSPLSLCSYCVIGHIAVVVMCGQRPVHEAQSDEWQQCQKSNNSTIHPKTFTTEAKKKPACRLRCIRVCAARRWRPRWGGVVRVRLAPCTWNVNDNVALSIHCRGTTRNSI